MKAGTYQRWLETPESARSGYLSVSKTRNAIARNESGATILSSGMPPTLTFAGDESYRSGRRSGKTNAAMQTIQTQTTPASTPSASQVWNVVFSTLQISITVTMPITSRIAGTGEWVRSFTSANFSGRSLSNAQANTVRTGMNVFPTIAGRLQKANDATIRIVRKSLLKTSEAMKWYQGPVGIVYAGGAAFTPDMNG